MALSFTIICSKWCPCSAIAVRSTQAIKHSSRSYNPSKKQGRPAHREIEAGLRNPYADHVEMASVCRADRSKCWLGFWVELKAQPHSWRFSTLCKALHSAVGDNDLKLKNQILEPMS